MTSDCPCGNEHEILTYRQTNHLYGEVWVGNDGECWVCDRG